MNPWVVTLRGTCEFTVQVEASTALDAVEAATEQIQQGDIDSREILWEAVELGEIEEEAD